MTNRHLIVKRGDENFVVNPLAAPKRIMLADSDASVRALLRRAISAQPDMNVVAEAHDVGGIHQGMAAVGPDVLVIDPLQFGLSGLDIIPIMRRQHPDTQLLVISQRRDVRYARTAKRKDACGYLLKSLSCEEVMMAIRLADENGFYLDPRLDCSGVEIQ